MFRKFVFEFFSHGVGRLQPGQGLLGELEVAPRNTVLWLPASEMQTGTFPTGRGKARRIRKPSGHAGHFY